MACDFRTDMAAGLAWHLCHLHHGAWDGNAAAFVAITLNALGQSARVFGRLDDAFDGGSGRTARPIMVDERAMSRVWGHVCIEGRALSPTNRVNLCAWGDAGAHKMCAYLVCNGCRYSCSALKVLRRRELNGGARCFRGDQGSDVSGAEILGFG